LLAKNTSHRFLLKGEAQPAEQQSFQVDDSSKAEGFGYTMFSILVGMLMLMQTLPTLETKRLILRTPSLADLDRWADMMSDAETTRYIGGLQPRAMVWRSMMAMIGAWHACGISMFSVIEKSSGRWLGRIGPWAPEGWPGLEVGWSLHRDAQGAGFAYEAASACVDYAVDVLQWPEIIHTIDPANVASQRLANRLGSKLIGAGKLPAPHEHASVEIWGQSAAAWRSRALIDGSRVS
jgi:RimJ/RimL family protein N-acetyltransferase